MLGQKKGLDKNKMTLKSKKIHNKQIIPIVLHKIVSGKTNEWEEFVLIN